MDPAQPEPSGRRRTPPPSIRTALATGGGSDRTAVLNLLDPEETVVIERGLRERGWRVLLTDAMFDLDMIAVAEESPAMVVTDDPSLNRSLPDLWEGRIPPLVVLVDDRDSAIEGAWKAGADWVITRPLDPVNLFQLGS